MLLAQGRYWRVTLLRDDAVGLSILREMLAGELADLRDLRVEVPLGQWNRVVLTANQNLIEVEVNGEKVTAIDLDQWTEPNRRPDGSRHKFDIAYKSHPRKGYIGLQDHGAPCWFKNIKLRPLMK